MKENSFKRNRKAMMALLLVTGSIETLQIFVMDYHIFIFAKTPNQKNHPVPAVLKMLRGNL